MLTYEQKLASDSRWALSEGSRHFEKESAVQHALQRIAKRLDELAIPYAIAGAMAMFQHGLRRFTEDVDILVTAEGLKTIHRKLEGLGYVPPFPGSKNLRDAESGVRIEFIVTGQYPGDGKPKPVAFPDPSSVSLERDGVRFLNIETLVELKLASGLSGLDRAKDIGDVQELIKTLDLPVSLADSLNAYVRPKYRELWNAVHQGQKRYLRLWPIELLSSDADLTHRAAAEELAAMRADGVTIDQERGAPAGYVYLVTTDPEIARKFEMHDESEFLGDFDSDREQSS